MSRSPRVPTVALGAVLALALGVTLGSPLSAQQKTTAAKTSAKQISAAHKRLGIGRPATPDEIAGWDIDVRPDGQGLPPGGGTVKAGEALYMQQCSACHGEFGESAGRWPILSGGNGSLATHDPVRSVGSYWPYASTLFDYIRRTMPFGNAQSLTNDELYALTAYVLYLNDIIRDESFELNATTFKAIKLPNERNFIDDDRETTERAFWRKNPCMSNCAPGTAKVTGRARAIDVTPESKTAPKLD